MKIQIYIVGHNQPKKANYHVNDIRGEAIKLSRPFPQIFLCMPQISLKENKVEFEID